MRRILSKVFEIVFTCFLQLNISCVSSCIPCLLFLMEAGVLNCTNFEIILVKKKRGFNVKGLNGKDS